MKKSERSQGVGLQGLSHWKDDLFDFSKPMRQGRKAEKSLQREMGDVTMQSGHVYELGLKRENSLLPYGL